MAPRHFCALAAGFAPSLGRAADYSIGHLAHGRCAALGSQCRRPEVADAARDDPVEPRQIRLDVEREAVHRTAAAEAHADGGDLARGAVEVRPNAGIPAQSAAAAHPQVGQRVDEHLFQVAHVRRCLGQSAAAATGQRQDRVADELAGTVVGEVAAAVDADAVGADLAGIDEQVGLICARTRSEDVVVFKQQQVVVRAVRPQAPLQVERFAEADPSEPAHLQHGVHS